MNTRVLLFGLAGLGVITGVIVWFTQVQSTGGTTTGGATSKQPGQASAVELSPTHELTPPPQNQPSALAKPEAAAPTGQPAAGAQRKTIDPLPVAPPVVANPGAHEPATEAPSRLRSIRRSCRPSLPSWAGARRSRASTRARPTPNAARARTCSNRLSTRTATRAATRRSRGLPGAQGRVDLAARQHGHASVRAEVVAHWWKGRPARYSASCASNLSTAVRPWRRAPTRSLAPRRARRRRTDRLRRRRRPAC